METEEREQVGLCLDCVHARIVPSRQARYWLCRLAAVDPRFARDPRLPVLACAGYVPGTGDREGADSPPPNDRED